MLDYSTLGVILGHELAHSFDALTRKENDQNGNLTWWPSELDNEYEALTKCFSDQFSSYVVESTGEYVSCIAPRFLATTRARDRKFVRAHICVSVDCSILDARN